MDLADRPGQPAEVVLGLNSASKTTLLRILAGAERPDGGRRVNCTGRLRLGYFAQGTTRSTPGAQCWRPRLAAPRPGGEARRVLGAFLFTGDDADKPAGVLSRQEKTRLAWPVVTPGRTSCCWTSPPATSIRPPATRCGAAGRSAAPRDGHARRGRRRRAATGPGPAPAGRGRGPWKRGLPGPDRPGLARSRPTRPPPRGPGRWGSPGAEGHRALMSSPLSARDQNGCRRQHGSRCR
ncbi:hypothetical protein LT493_43915 [Streptomyces tricolor]|nr:hypothetical protein [Streptomyces tricolor]